MLIDLEVFNLRCWFWFRTNVTIKHKKRLGVLGQIYKKVVVLKLT